MLIIVLAALTSGCYTVSSHPDVYIPSEKGKMEMYELSVNDNCFECHSTYEVEEYKKLMPVNQSDFAFTQNSFYLYSTYKVYDYYNTEPWWEDYEFTSREEVISNKDFQRDETDARYRDDEILGGVPGPPKYYPPPTVSVPTVSTGSDNSSVQTKVRTNSSSNSGSATRNSSGDRSNNSRKKR